jgi:nicotinamidase-related amidase
MNPNTALLVIDVQVNMFDPSHAVASADGLLAHVRSLVSRARTAGAPVVFVRNCGGPQDPDVKGTPGWELHPALQPAGGELVLDKTTCDTFASTPLGEELDARGVRRVVIAGLQSDYCIRETTLGALARGLEVTLVADAHSTYDNRQRSAAQITAAVNTEFAGRAVLTPAEGVGFS